MSLLIPIPNTQRLWWAYRRLFGLRIKLYIKENLTSWKIFIYIRDLFVSYSNLWEGYDRRMIICTRLSPCLVSSILRNWHGPSFLNTIVVHFFNFLFWRVLRLHPFVPFGFLSTSRPVLLDNCCISVFSFFLLFLLALSYKFSEVSVFYFYN